jgi:hypothetical protein
MFTIVVLANQDKSIFGAGLETLFEWLDLESNRQLCARCEVFVRGSHASLEERRSRNEDIIDNNDVLPPEHDGIMDAVKSSRKDFVIIVASGTVPGPLLFQEMSRIIAEKDLVRLQQTWWCTRREVPEGDRDLLLNDTQSYVQMAAAHKSVSDEFHSCFNGHGAPAIMGAPTQAWVHALTKVGSSCLMTDDWLPLAEALFESTGPFWNMHHVVNCDFYHVSPSTASPTVDEEELVLTDQEINSKVSYTTGDALAEALQNINVARIEQLSVPEDAASQVQSLYSESRTISFTKSDKDRKIRPLKSGKKISMFVRSILQRSLSSFRKDDAAPYSGDK